MNAPTLNRTRPLRGRSQARGLRDRAIDVARELFATHGYEATTMRMLAHALGVSTTALYYHFPGKEAIREGAVERGLELLQQDLERSVQQSPSPLVALERAARVRFRHAASGIDAAGFAGSEGSSSGADSTELALADLGIPDMGLPVPNGPQPVSRMVVLKRSQERLFSDLVTRCNQAGLARAAEPRVAARAILLLAEGASTLSRGAANAGDAEDQFVELVRGLVHADESGQAQPARRERASSSAGVPK